MKTKIQKARETLKNIKKLKANHLDDFFRYILKKYYSQPMTIKHISDSFVKCLKITHGEVYRFDSSSVVIMPFLKAPLFS